MGGNRQVALAMFRSLLVVSLLVLWQLGCGSSPVPPAGGGSRAANISLSPASAAVGRQRTAKKSNAADRLDTSLISENGNATDSRTCTESLGEATISARRFD